MIDSNSFREACGKWCTGVAVITCTNPVGKNFGLTMSAVTPLSLDPPLFLICLDKDSETLKAIKSSSHFCINILSELQQSISNHFASKGKNKFDSINWSNSQNGCPKLDDCLLNIECKKKSISLGGDHHIVIGEPTSLHFEPSHDLRPLAYYRSSYCSIAKSKL
ncbi:MAG: hypothetical protein CBC29_01240 [Methylococcaceae bacterium TMED69]|nr:MAG: hypothetical protein CBC29_01240 [Methylococcaceae bacterium TMED69]